MLTCVVPVDPFSCYGAGEHGDPCKDAAKCCTCWPLSLLLGRWAWWPLSGCWHVLYLLTPIAAMGPVSMVTPARMLPTKEMLPHGSWNSCHVGSARVPIVYNLYTVYIYKLIINNLIQNTDFKFKIISSIWEMLRHEISGCVFGP